TLERSRMPPSTTAPSRGPLSPAVENVTSFMGRGLYLAALEARDSPGGHVRDAADVGRIVVLRGLLVRGPGVVEEAVALQDPAPPVPVRRRGLAEARHPHALQHQRPGLARATRLRVRRGQRVEDREVLPSGALDALGRPLDRALVRAAADQPEPGGL